MNESMHVFEGEPTHSFEIRFDLTPEVTWGLCSDTDRLNAATGLPQIRYEDEPQEKGIPRRTFSFELEGMSIHGEEFPSTWEQYRYFDINRHYSQGFVSDLRHRCELEPIDRGVEPPGCLLRFNYWMRARDQPGEAFIKSFGENVIEPLKEFLDDAGRALAAELESQTSGSEVIEIHTSLLLQTALREPEPHEMARVQSLVEDTEKIHPSGLAERIGDLVLFAPDHELRRIRPLKLARKWQVDLDELLPSFLAATRTGLLSLHWDLICPHCRGGQNRKSALAEVEATARCVPCGIDFDVDLSRALEAVFVPHPQLRNIESMPYCMAGPGTRPHVLYQAPLSPGGDYQVTLALQPGRYRLRCDGAEGFRWLRIVAPSGKNDRDEPALECSVEHGQINGPDLVVHHGADQQITINNRWDQPVVVVIEDPEWAAEALVASDLIAHQKFRDLFSHDMLAQGVSLSISSVTILFTDLVGSTAMYGELGDARAFGLVWAHFDLLKDIVSRTGGTTIKTIGDAVMAAFARPEDSLEAARMLHEEIGPFLVERGFSYPVSLKVGVHTGASIAVTLNDRMDYFGGTVNLAARVESKSEGGDIVVSPDHARLTRDCATLRERGWSSEPVLAHLKGFAEPIELLRFCRAETPVT